MLRLWPDELGVFLAPRRLCVVRFRRGLKAKILREEDLELPADAAGPGGWEGALAALESKLADPLWGGASMRAVIADHWVRYAVVPYAAELSSEAEREAHAREMLGSLYGDAVSGWALCVSDAPPGASRLACAMPSALLEGLREACRRVGAKLISLQPQLIAAHNHWRGAMPATDAWFVTIDEGSLAAARLRADGFDRVHTVRIGADWVRELKRLQTFGRLSNTSATDGRVYVDAPRAWREAGSEMGGDLEWLDHTTERPTTLRRLEQLRRGAA